MSASSADSATPPSGGSSYGQILKSSSIVGGAQAVNYIIGLVRTKAVAVLLGPAGVGLVGVYVSTVGLVQTFAQFGINESGVREVAAAAGTKDEVRIAQTVTALRRVCWLTGVFGWLLTVALAMPLSEWVLGSSAHAWTIAVLGVTVLLELVSSGQKAVLQGVRRVGDLARLQIAFSLLSTVMAVSVYWFFGEGGIVPVIILTSVTQLLASWWFARRVRLVAVSQTFRQTGRNCGLLFKMGSAFMYGALLAGVVGLVVRALIVREHGLDDAGVYQAAWALSGLFGGFVLQAMGTDFYPRLTSVAGDNSTVNGLVNEQIEVGMLLALPGITAAITLAPLLVWIFYSAQFESAALLLPGFIVGVGAQMLVWPISFIQRAKAAVRYMYVSQGIFAVTQLLLTIAGLRMFGLSGVAWAYAATMCVHVFVLMFIASRLSGFSLSSQTFRLLVVVACFVGVSLGVATMSNNALRFALGVAVALGAGLCSWKALALRLGEDHPLSRFMGRMCAPRV